MHHRVLKKTVRDLLAGPDLDTALAELYQMNLRRVINPLFSFFCSGEEMLRWRAITAAGAVITKMTETRMEDARVMMRRLMWTLNDESGGIGWGAPEAMGETMARNPRLTKEYAAILVSYLNPDGNYLEHADLQCGVLWGLGRLAAERPLAAAAAAPFLQPFLTSALPRHRGLAAWCASSVATVTAAPIPAQLYADKTVIRLYRDETFHEVPIHKLAGEHRKT
jgi:hypothetical protein